VSFLGSYDYEIRFTAAGGLAYDGFDTGGVYEVPFELWRTGIATPNDPSDDTRLVPYVCYYCNGALDNGEFTFDIGGDHGVSGGANDPYSQWIYWFTPDDMTPGDAGYQSFFFGDGGAHEVMGRQVLVCWNCGSAPPYPMTQPETGTTFRYETLKPNAEGDSFSLNTADVDGDGSMRAIGALSLSELDPTTRQELEVAALENIGIVPNPYKGASLYERSQLVDQVRFTNLPETATIRIFSLNGTLLRTLEKSGPAKTLPWDLTTDNLLPIASGLYLIHVEVPGVGEHIMKFAVVKKRIHLNVF
jgi:hypothetical protein